MCCWHWLRPLLSVRFLLDWGVWLLGFGVGGVWCYLFGCLVVLLLCWLFWLSCGFAGLDIPRGCIVL